MKEKEKLIQLDNKSLKKLEKYEDIYEETQSFIQTEIGRNESLLEALRLIDSREMFEKDDEVGSIFYQIKETIEKFKQQKDFKRKMTQNIIENC